MLKGCWTKRLQRNVELILTCWHLRASGWGSLKHLRSKIILPRLTRQSRRCHAPFASAPRLLEHSSLVNSIKRGELGCGRDEPMHQNAMRDLATSLLVIALDTYSPPLDPHPSSPPLGPGAALLNPVEIIQRSPRCLLHSMHVSNLGRAS